jgi:hypothetical protein
MKIFLNGCPLLKEYFKEECLGGTPQKYGGTVYKQQKRR